jgi:hypothetical protein
LMDEILDYRLREIRSRLLRGDPLLAQVVNLTGRSRTGIQIGLVLQLAGCTVRGIPTEATRSGEAVDDEVGHYFRVLAALAAANDRNPAKYHEVVADFEGLDPGFAKTVRGDLDDRDELFSALDEAGLEFPDELSELPPHIREKALGVTAPPRAVTLDSAAMRVGSADWEDIGSMRVVLHNVQAWWTFRLGVPDEAVPFLPDDEPAVDDEPGHRAPESP